MKINILDLEEGGFDFTDILEGSILRHSPSLKLKSVSRVPVRLENGAKDEWGNDYYIDFTCSVDEYTSDRWGNQQKVEQDYMLPIPYVRPLVTDLIGTDTFYVKAVGVIPGKPFKVSVPMLKLKDDTVTFTDYSNTPLLLETTAAFNSVNGAILKEAPVKVFITAVKGATEIAPPPPVFLNGIKISNTYSFRAKTGKVNAASYFLAPIVGVTGKGVIENVTADNYIKVLTPLLNAETKQTWSADTVAPYSLLNSKFLHISNPDKSLELYSITLDDASCTSVTGSILITISTEE